MDTNRDTSSAGRVLLIACGALAREILDVIALNKLSHLDLQCLPAHLHNTPQDIPAAVRDAVREKGAGYAQVFVAYADCGTGGLLRQTCDDLGIEMIAGPHCYSFFEGNARFAERDEFMAFYLTDFLVRQFDAFVWRPLGLDRYPDLRDTYFAHYEKLVYQAQTDDPELTRLAHRCAERLGLPFERRLTGYGDLADTLIHLSRSHEPAGPSPSAR
jgi:hypothetical protein